ncbi:hypothetical protein [Guptibacillus hwajinpoensis]|uniref:SpoIIIAH-like family protein n=1 Tax=Guptibacillus hwajinpoensis TaxID=208199 RepID=A0ABU0K154_9BACL|nr:hypothetical protein [Alkalihalobacillus hemicentroti]MDQ0482153.1 hypothetical protein [Alkalihalobacillus hemicentroti]
MKKRIIGFVILFCIAIGLYLVFNYNSEEKATFPETKQLVDPERISRELALITNEVMEGLKSNNLVGDIHTDYQESVTVQTSISSSDKKAQTLKNDIEETVDEIMKSDKLKAVSKIKSYQIYVSNKDGEIIE